jgi:hypothetical protein
MTSGDVKESILRTAATHSTQLILFLTRSEIRDVEDLIDAFAGKVWTLSNSAHFPTMLVHDPGSVLQGLVCSCDHRQLCDSCEGTVASGRRAAPASSKVEPLPMQRAVKPPKAVNHNGHVLRSGVPVEAIEGADR